MESFNSSQFLKNELDENICYDLANPVLIYMPFPLPMEEAYDFCESINSKMQLPVGKDFEVFNGTMWNDKCGDTIWVPVSKDDQGNWIHHGNKSKIFSINWEKGEPNGKEFQNCLNLFVGKRTFRDLFCNFKKCFLCKFDAAIKFNLRGLGENSIIDDKYVLLPNVSYQERTITFKGFKSGYITYDHKSESWIVSNDVGSSSHLIAKTNATNPIGLREWIIYENQGIGPFSTFLKLTKVFQILTVFCCNCNFQENKAHCYFLGGWFREPCEILRSHIYRLCAVVIDLRK